MKIELNDSLIKKSQIIGLIILLVFIVIAGGYLYYSWEEKKARENKRQELEAIAKLKIELISEWHKDELLDAAIISQNSILIDMLEVYRKNRSEKNKSYIVRLLEQIKREHGYRNIIIASLSGKIIAATDNDIFELAGKRLDLMFISIDRDTILSSDLYKDDAGNIIIDFISVIRNNSGEEMAAIILELSPYDFLYPHLANWPYPNSTSESILIRKEKDSVLFLSGLRKVELPVLDFRLSLSRKDLPAVQAALGYKGIFEGKDYFGAEVLAYIGDIPGTNWLIVAKIDKSELFEGLYIRAVLIAILISLTVVLIGAFFSVVYNFRQKKIFRELYLKESELSRFREGFKVTLDSLGDAVISVDTDGNIQYLNNVAENLTGWNIDEAKGVQLNKVFNIINEYSREKVDNPVTRILIEGAVIGIANHTILISKNGDERPIADSGAPIKDKNGNVVGVVLVFRDQTNERERQKRIEISEERFRVVMKNSKIIAAICDLDLRYIWIYNPHPDFKNFDIIGKRDDEFGDNEGIRRLMQLKRETIERNEGMREEISFSLSEGIITYDITFEPLRDSDLRVIGVTTAAFDITDRKRIEEKLRDNEAKYRALADNGRALIWMSGTDKKCVYFNKPWLEFTGRTLEQELGDGWTEGVHPDDVERCLYIYTVAFDKRERFSMDYRLRHADGAYRWIIDDGAPIYDADGKFIGYIRHCLDINWRKLAEEKLRFQALALTQIKDCITVTDLKGIITYINDAECSTLGMTREQIIGKHVSVYGDNPRYGATQEEIIKETLEKGEWRGEVANYRSDGKEVIFDCRIRLISDENGTPIGMCGISTDVTETKRFEKRLKELVHMLDIAPNSIMAHDFEGNFIYVNEMTLKIHGYTREEFLSLNLKDIDTPQSAAMIAERIKIIREKGEASFEVAHYKKDGGIIPLEVYVKIAEWSDKIVMLSVANDITERKRAETIRQMQYNIVKAVAVSRDLDELFELLRNELNELIDAKNFYIAFYDEKTGMLRSNVDHDEKDTIPEWPAEKSLTGRVVKLKKSLLLKKNDVVKLVKRGEIDFIGTASEAWLGVPLKVDGKIIGAIVVQSYDNPDAYDKPGVELFELAAHELGLYIQKQKAEEIALKLSKAVVQSPAIVMITDINGRIEYVNPKFTEITGYALDEVIGQNPRILKSGAIHAEQYENLWKTILSGGEWKGELYNRAKNGELYWEDAVISGIKNEKGEITHFIAVKEDITEKKKMIEELIAAKEKAEEINKLKSHFFANMSHELRTPFVGIMGYAELLVSLLKDQELKEMAEGILRTSIRMKETLTKILDLSKIEFSEGDLISDIIDVSAMIDEVYNQYKKGAERKNISLEKKIAFEPFLMHGNHELFWGILNNLVSNAIIYTEKGRVEIVAEKKFLTGEEKLILKVIDTGIGIPKDKREIIWEEFRQASEGINRNFQGSGLGLSIVKKYAEILNGKAYVESEVGKGSSFIVEIPLISVSNREK